MHTKEILAYNFGKTANQKVQYVFRNLDFAHLLLIVYLLTKNTNTNSNSSSLDRPISSLQPQLGYLEKSKIQQQPHFVF